MSSSAAKPGWSDAMLDAFRLVERLLGDAPEGSVGTHVRAALDARGADTRALAKRVAARLRPAPPTERVLTAPARVRALLGSPGATPRKRYAPPPGLADTLRRALLVAPRRVDPAWRGLGRAAMAAVEDGALFERVVARLGAEEEGAVRTLRTLDDTRTSTHERAVRALVVVGGGAELLGAIVAGYDGANGEGAVRAGRELRMTEPSAADPADPVEPAADPADPVDPSAAELRGMGET
ncbi:MAG: hypothetical protein MUE69_01900 [Myxococcota bacterium]|jgi:hypothetical protein|nr:hypothetical protein [Myxococcota bacterium]